VCTPEQFNELNRIMEEASAEVGHSALRIGHNL